jgi:hypothetical protein
LEDGSISPPHQQANPASGQVQTRSVQVCSSACPRIVSLRWQILVGSVPKFAIRAAHLPRIFHRYPRHPCTHFAPFVSSPFAGCDHPFLLSNF